MAVLVCIPTNSVRGFPFLHTLSSILMACYAAKVRVGAEVLGPEWFLHGRSNQPHCFCPECAWPWGLLHTSPLKADGWHMDCWGLFMGPRVTLGHTGWCRVLGDLLVLAAASVKVLKMLVAVGFLLEWLRSEAGAAPGTSHQLKTPQPLRALWYLHNFAGLVLTLGRIFEIVPETPRTGTKT